MPHGEHLLRSHFQPIFSFSHQRLIGHEALLRASDRSGRPVLPQHMFERCATLDERRDLDRACSSMHARGFARGIDSAQWLFLNVDSSAFDPQRDVPASADAIRASIVAAGLQPNQVVVELLEDALPDGPAFEHWTVELKRLGFVIALDDFGAGHSNFDRVFRLRPHIVKLDRSVIVRAAVDPTVRRVAAQMISLLHECGAQVLIEGVETAVEANIALDSDADFVQGYHFGRPAPALRRLRQHCPELIDVWASCDERAALEAKVHATRVAPYCDALLQALAMLRVGTPLRDACAAFLRLDDADVCYLLDETGEQVEPRVFHERTRVGGDLCAQFAPLHDVDGARWSRRPYFRAALAAPGEPQVTRPYPTMHSSLTSVTISVSFCMNDIRYVLCGDKLWSASDETIAPPVTPAVDVRRRSGPPWRLDAANATVSPNGPHAAIA